MKDSEKLNIIKKNLLFYEATIERRGFLYDDEGVIYAILKWFEKILATPLKEDVEDDLFKWIEEKGIKLYNLRQR
jgi:hypothetical protein